MKSLIVFFLFFFSSFVAAREIESLSDFHSRISVSRIVNHKMLVDYKDLKVMVTVYDHGGSTDVSPTQQLFFSIYQKGEMFSTDAAFDLGAIYSFVSAKRISGGIYEIKISGVDEDTSMPVDKTLVVDAQKAILEIRKVTCDDFDCDASTHFKSVIDLTETKPL